jgi:hypothetical protein
VVQRLLQVLLRRHLHLLLLHLRFASVSSSNTTNLFIT